MRITCSLIGVLLVCCTLQLMAQDIFENPTWKELVSYECRDTPVDVVIKAIFENSGVNYSIENPGIKYLKIRNLTLKDVPRIQALKTITRLSDLVYRVENDTVLIDLKPGLSNPWTKIVSVDVNRKPLGDVLPDLLKSVGLSFTLEPDAAKLIVNSLKLTDVSFAEAFGKLLDSAGATYIDDKVINIVPKQSSKTKDKQVYPQTQAEAFPGVKVTRTADNADPWLRRLDLNVKDALLRNVVDALFRGTSLNYAIEPNINMQTAVDSMQLKDVTFREALEKVLDRGDAVYTTVQQGQVVVIKARAVPTVQNKMVNLEVKDMPLPQVMELLFKDTGVDYAIDPDVDRMRITATLTNIPFETALNSLTSATDLAFRIEKGVYRISRKEKATTAPVSDGSSKKTTPLSVASTNGKTGYDSTAREISLQVKMEVLRSAKGKTNENKGIGGPFMISTYEGQMATVSVSRSGPPGPDGQGRVIGLVSISLTPTILTDGQISVSGTVDYVDGQYSARKVKILAVLQPGKSQKLSTINIPSTKDRTKTLIDLTLAATLIK